MSGIIDVVESVDQSALIHHALNEIKEKYGAIVSVENKAKSLLKFGERATVTAGWETLMTTLGSELQETLLSTNAITTIVSDNAADTGTVYLEDQTIAGGDMTFGAQTVPLNGTTPVALDTPCARATRIANAGTAALVGNVYVYEGGTRTSANTHISIAAGSQQSQKCATSISANDFWIITGATVNVLSKTSKDSEARIEIRRIGDDYWLPLTQTFKGTDTTGTIPLNLVPYRIVPSNYDVRLAVKTSTSGVDVSGGIAGFLAN